MMVVVARICSATALAGSIGMPNSADSVVTQLARESTEHSGILAAGFGFQAADSSMITVRTYHAQTGALLSEDSFELNVKEEGVAEHDQNKGRIFAGGMGLDATGKFKFILRVYDAESGKFLWEGQLNLLRPGEGGMTKTAILTRNERIVVHPTALKEKALQTLFSVRAINPITGGVVWQDQFVPGAKKKVKAAVMLGERTGGVKVGEPIGHVFDLVVKTYERNSGKLLWQDSFEELAHIDEPLSESEGEPRPQVIPLWNTYGTAGVDMLRISAR
jgi:hypothetical protein